MNKDAKESTIKVSDDSKASVDTIATNVNNSTKTISNDV